MNKRLLAAAQAVLTAATLMIGSIPVSAAEEKTENVLVEQKLVMRPDAEPVQGEIIQPTRGRKSAPAKSRTQESTVTLQGELPEGILGEAVTVDPNDYIEPTDCNIFCAYDISLYEKDLKYEPDDSLITVSVTAESLLQAEEDGIALTVVHIPDSPADPVQYITDYSLSGGTLTFTADSFSVYMIIDNGESGEDQVRVKKRNVYHYLTGEKNEDGLISNTPYLFNTIDENGVVANGQVSTQIVKDGDTLQEPPLPPEKDGQQFLGWYLVAVTDEPASEDTAFEWPAPADLQRQKFGDEVSVTADNVHYYLAPLYQEYRILVFHDNPQDAAADSILTKRMVVLGTSADNSFSAETDISSPVASDVDATSKFNGWMIGDTVHPVQSGTSCMLTITPEEYPDIYIHLYPDYVDAHWINFDKNAGDATYISPLLVRAVNDPLTNEKFDNCIPTRPRYRFTGWYTVEDKEQQNAATLFAAAVLDDDGNVIGLDLADAYEGQQIGEDMTVYAGWTFNEGVAPYKVVYWIQKTDITPSEDINDYRNYAYFGDAFTVNGESVGYKEYTAEPETLVNATEYPDVDSNCFILRGTDGPKEVSESGNTVINVYYDRVPKTIDFYIYNYDYNYTETTSDSGTQYGWIDGQYRQLTRQQSGTRFQYSHPNYTTYSAQSWANNSYTVYVVDDDGAYKTMTLYSYRYNWYTDSGHRNPYNGTVYHISGTVNDYTGTRYVKSGDSFVATTSEEGTLYGKDANGHYVELTSTEVTAYSWYYNGQEYSGTRYTRSRTRSYGWHLYKRISGLYGQTFDQAHVEWPTEYDWYESHETSSVSGSRITFLNGFTQDAKSAYYGQTPAGGSGKVEFIKQNLDGTWEDDPFVISVNSTNFRFTLTEKYENQGFHLYEYSKDGVNWDTANNNDEITGCRELYIRYARNIHHFIFLDEHGAQIAEKEVPFGGTISDYVQNPPSYTFDDPTKTFEHWCADAAGSQEFKFDENIMPDNDVVVYPGSKLIKFPITVDPNYGELLSGDSTYFSVEYGDKIGKYTSTRTFIEDPEGDYVYIYVTEDEEHPAPNRIAKYVLADSEEAQTYSYYIRDPDKRYRRMTEEDGRYEFVGWYEDSIDGKPFNFDEKMERSVNLVARWKRVGVKYRVTYNPVMEDATGRLIAGVIPQSQEVDPPIPANAENLNNYGYVDGTEAIVLGAPENITSGYLFEYWQDQNGRTYQPGDILTVGDDLANGFVIPLQAVYATVEESIHSQKRVHLWLHPNPPDGSTEQEAGIEKLRDLQVNQRVELGDCGNNWSYTGYELVGWSTEPQDPVMRWDGDNLPDGFFNRSDEVGADLNASVDADGYTNHLYAVWKVVIPAPTLYQDAAEPFLFLTIIVGAAFVLMLYNRRRKGGDVDETSPL